MGTQFNNFPDMEETVARFEYQTNEVFNDLLQPKIYYTKNVIAKKLKKLVSVQSRRGLHVV